MNFQIVFDFLFAVWVSCVYSCKSKIYNNRLFEYLGKISYSFYIWQIGAIYVGSLILKSQPCVNLNFLVVIMLALNVCFSAISYHFIEEKFRISILKKFGGKK